MADRLACLPSVKQGISCAMRQYGQNGLALGARIQLDSCLPRPAEDPTLQQVARPTLAYVNPPNRSCFSVRECWTQMPMTHHFPLD